MKRYEINRISLKGNVPIATPIGFHLEITLTLTYYIRLHGLLKIIARISESIARSTRSRRIKYWNAIRPNNCVGFLFAIVTLTRSNLQQSSRKILATFPLFFLNKKAFLSDKVWRTNETCYRKAISTTKAQEFREIRPQSAATTCNCSAVHACVLF